MLKSLIEEMTKLSVSVDNDDLSFLADIHHMTTGIETHYNTKTEQYDLTEQKWKDQNL